MPLSSGEDDEFRVSMSSLISAEIRRLQRLATEEGRRTEFLIAFRSISERLRVSPRELGEPFQDMDKAHLQLRHVLLRPVYMEFAVHETERIVFIRTVKYLELPS